MTDILILKTDIKFKKDLKKMGQVLNANPCIINWNIDRKDIDKYYELKQLILTPVN